MASSSSSSLRMRRCPDASLAAGSADCRWCRDQVPKEQSNLRVYKEIWKKKQKKKNYFRGECVNLWCYLSEASCPVSGAGLLPPPVPVPLDPPPPAASPAPGEEGKGCCCCCCCCCLVANPDTNRRSLPERRRAAISAEILKRREWTEEKSATKVFFLPKTTLKAKHDVSYMLDYGEQ